MTTKEIATSPVERAFLDAISQQKAEGRLRLLGQKETPKPTNRFTNGLYSRELRMEAGTVWLSRVHKTEHQFVVSDGICDVWTEEIGGWRLHEAPFHGITKPGTQRVLMILMDCVWTTFHPTFEQDVATLEEQLCEPIPAELLQLVQSVRDEEG